MAAATRISGATHSVADGVSAREPTASVFLRPRAAEAAAAL